MSQNRGPQSYILNTKKEGFEAIPTCTKEEQIINLNALVPSQKLYFPKHVLAIFVSVSTKKNIQKNQLQKLAIFICV